MSFVVSHRSRPVGSGLMALFTAVALMIALAAPATATFTKPYTATWLSGSTPVANPPNQINLPGGSTTAVMRIKNYAFVSLGSADITPPSGYTLGGGSLAPTVGTATLAGNTLKLRNLSLAPGASVNVTISLSTSCLSSPGSEWALTVKQGGNFTGTTFVRKHGTVAPKTVTAGSTCRLRFASQPNTTETGALIRDGHDSTGNPVKVEIYDPGTGLTVSSTAAVTLTLQSNPAGGTLSGGSANAVGGVAKFPSLSIGTPGPYTLKASSPAASNAPVSDDFNIANTVATCAGAGCTFTDTQGQNSYKTKPQQGTAGATWASSLNLPGLKVSCNFAPFNYPESRQPNAVWFIYDDGSTGSAKLNTIVIDKTIVQETPENGTSKYRVCYSSPDPFKDRTGHWAQPDPWSNGPSAYFGGTWFTGLLPDCSHAHDAHDNDRHSSSSPVAPCVLKWTAKNGDRIGTFLTPPGDPTYR
jgi:hypothetical protein